MCTQADTLDDIMSMATETLCTYVVFLNDDIKKILKDTLKTKFWIKWITMTARCIPATFSKYCYS